MSLVQFWQAHLPELARLTGQHVVLVAVSTGIAVALGVPAGILAWRRPPLGRPLLFLANVAQTIPSLALLGFLLPLPFVGGLGPRTALVVLTLYALLPIMRTTVAGLRGIAPAIVEAGTAMGMTSRQLLYLVELPLALPSIVAGIRVATVVGVGTATVAAAIGAGGLGEYIYRGLSMVDSTVILAGAIPAALLALAVDAALLGFERRLGVHRATHRAPGAAVVMAALAAVVVLSGALLATREAAAIVVGSKNFTEQVILGEIVAQTIERETGLGVDRRLNLGGTLICERALASGDIDVYVEYTGTALTAVFHRPLTTDPQAVLAAVREAYARTGRTVLAPLGFNNTFTILVRGRDARELQLRTIEDAAKVSSRWRAGFGYEFLERPDGYAGLARTYGLRFAEPPRVMDLTLTYRALASGQVDLIAGDATAGLIGALDLFPLEDSRRYFPPYDAVPVARADVLLRFPEVRRAIESLAGRIPADAMRAMNHAADAGREDPASVARRFLDGR